MGGLFSRRQDQPRTPLPIVYSVEDMFERAYQHMMTRAQRSIDFAAERKRAQAVFAVPMIKTTNSVLLAVLQALEKDGLIVSCEWCKRAWGEPAYYESAWNGYSDGPGVEVTITPGKRVLQEAKVDNCTVVVGASEEDVLVATIV